MKVKYKLTFVNAMKKIIMKTLITTISFSNRVLAQQFDSEEGFTYKPKGCHILEISPSSIT